MANNYQDPKTYLNNAVTKRGKSGAEGVYLTNVTVVAEATADYGYKLNLAGTALFYPPFPFEQENWLTLLVSLRGGSRETPHHVSTKSEIFQFVPEGGNISLNVFVPYLNADIFEVYVSECQEMLQFICDFSGKIPTFIRFHIGYAFRKWDTLAEEGEVEEQDFSF